jgi:hypothetical protein
MPDPSPEDRLTALIDARLDEKLKGFGESMTESFQRILDERVNVEDGDGDGGGQGGEGGGEGGGGEPPPKSWMEKLLGL